MYVLVHSPDVVEHAGEKIRLDEGSQRSMRGRRGAG